MKNTVETIVEIFGTEFEATVEYFYQRGYPATRDEPECPAEFDIQSIMVTNPENGKRLDISDLFTLEMFTVLESQFESENEPDGDDGDDGDDCDCGDDYFGGE